MREGKNIIKEYMYIKVTENGHLVWVGRLTCT